MRDALKSFTDAPGENLAAPDCPVISVAGAVKTGTDDALIPGTAFGDHGRDMGAMMLNGQLFGCIQLQSVSCRNILRMRIVNEQQSAHVNFIHGEQIPDRFSVGAKRFVVIEVSDMLADESLAIHDKRNRVFEIRT